MSGEKLPPIGNRTFYMKGFTITRKIDFEGSKEAFTDILREIADVVDEMGLDGTDINQFTFYNNKELKFNIQLLEKRG